MVEPLVLGVEEHTQPWGPEPALGAAAGFPAVSPQQLSSLQARCE